MNLILYIVIFIYLATVEYFYILFISLKKCPVKIQTICTYIFSIFFCKISQGLFCTIFDLFKLKFDINCKPGKVWLVYLDSILLKCFWIKLQTSTGHTEALVGMYVSVRNQVEFDPSVVIKIFPDHLTIFMTTLVVVIKIPRIQHSNTWKSFWYDQFSYKIM